EVYARIWVVKSAEGGVETRSIAQSDSKLANELSGAIRTGWPNGRGNESTANSCNRRGIEIAGEPLTELSAGADDVQRRALIARNADITCLDESRIHAHPEATIPSTNSRHLPAPYQKVERRRNVSAKAFASPEGKFIDAIESDPVRRDGGVVEVDEPPPLVVAEIWFTKQFDTLWYGPPAISVHQKPASAATIDRGVPRSEERRVGKERRAW